MTASNPAKPFITTTPRIGVGGLTIEAEWDHEALLLSIRMPVEAVLRVTRRPGGGVRWAIFASERVDCVRP